jgi:hypothetical protein
MLVVMISKLWKPDIGNFRETGIGETRNWKVETPSEKI